MTIDIVQRKAGLPRQQLLEGDVALVCACGNRDSAPSTWFASRVTPTIECSAECGGVMRLAYDDDDEDEDDEDDDDDLDDEDEDDDDDEEEWDCMQQFLIELSCLDGHQQQITVRMPPQHVRDYADMLAGRSTFFVYPIPETQLRGAPGTVGFCGCGARINAPEVTEVVA